MAIHLSGYTSHLWWDGIKDSQPLIEKITSRIANWKNYFLTYAGRVELIKSVLSSFLVYWARTSLLPKTVLSNINSPINRFLWEGPGMQRKVHQASSKRICKPKKEGGLGIKDAITWNRAATCGIVFKLLQNNTLWANWIHDNQLKGKHFWTCKPPTDSSWTWRTLLKMRRSATSLICYTIADGKNTLFWHDPWCGNDLLWNNSEARNTFSLHSNAIVFTMISNGHWNDQIQQMNASPLRSRILATEIDPFLEYGRIFWKPSTSGEFDQKSAYNYLSGTNQALPQSKIIWGPWVLPKHAFTVWQLTMDCLPTQDRLVKKGILQESKCILCNSHRENSHLL